MNIVSYQYECVLSHCKVAGCGKRCHLSCTPCRPLITDPLHDKSRSGLFEEGQQPCTCLDSNTVFTNGNAEAEVQKLNTIMHPPMTMQHAGFAIQLEHSNESRSCRLLRQTHCQDRKGSDVQSICSLCLPHVSSQMWPIGSSHVSIRMHSRQDVAVARICSRWQLLVCKPLQAPKIKQYTLSTSGYCSVDAGLQ